jgi:hypothetical protein
MAKDENQNEFSIPASLEDQQNRKTARHLPRFFRTDSNKKFLGGTLDPLTQPGKLTRINGYVGRRDVPNFQFTDNYLSENSVSRQYYQLEPSFVNENSVTGEVNWYSDYIDYVNQLKYFGASTANHNKLNKQESYTWDPHINWDKFTNYREYYWLPTGPDPVTIYGEVESTNSVYTITAKDQGDNIAYVFSPDGLTVNPRLTVYRGLTYKFEINAPTTKFSIKTRPTADDRFFYNVGINNQQVDIGVVEWQVARDTPNLLYYINNTNGDVVGTIDVKNIEEASFLDIEAEIIGKKYFSSSTGVVFVNGLKVKFAGKVTPEKYANDFWYIEGVGDKITLVSAKDLEPPAIYGSDRDVPFDNEPFDSLPWDNLSNYPNSKDYIVIDRASVDLNSWSRNNRWFHRNVIETSAIANGQVAIFDQEKRALRPIIEFEKNLKLYNHGYIAKPNVNLVDTITTDVFSTIEGSISYNVDGEDLLDGYLVLFTNDKDPIVNGRIFRVKFIFNANENKRQITLVDTDITEPNDGESVYVISGKNYKGFSFHYENSKWNISQRKSLINQAPLFDLFSGTRVSYGNKVENPSSTFTGNKLFSYKDAQGSNDTELGFPISYRNIENIGDIEFTFNLETDTFLIQENNVNYTVPAYSCYLRKYQDGNFEYVNGWTKTDRLSEQNVIKIVKVDQPTNFVPIDVYENVRNISDLRIKVYVNDVKRTDVTLDTVNEDVYIRFSTDLNVGDKVVYKIRSIANKNQRGYYEVPLNWQNNPFNQPLEFFTFGEVVDHTRTIVENVSNFDGAFPGISNLESLGKISQYGRKFMQHAGPMGVSSFLMVDKDANLVKSIRWAAKKYTEFKKEFLRLSETLELNGSISDQVDQILIKFSKNKSTSSAAFYYSDMSPYGAASIRNYEVVDPRFPVFVIDSKFTPLGKTSRSILIYHNEQQLVHNRDYVFDETDAFVNITKSLSLGDKIQIRDYASTNGCYIPTTPSKLGIYPSYIPEIYVDDTYLNPTKVIQGHDGSIIVAFDDYRDDLILELEKRIFNTQRISYDDTIFNIYDVVSGYYRRNDFTKTEINNILLVDFLKWNSIPNLNFNSNDYFVEGNSFSYNYNRSLAPNGVDPLQGYWRGIYKYFYDTDRPHTHPWEMQGFSIKPTWWDTVYGEAPYTNNNRILWDNIERGFIAEPTNLRFDVRYARPGIVKHIPVDAEGKLLSPLDSDLAFNFSLVTGQGQYNFGDNAPVETSWRKSSEYPYAVAVLMSVLRGADFIGKMFDRFSITRNIAGQVFNLNTGKRLSNINLPYPGIVDQNGTVSRTSGLINFVEDYVSFKKYSDKNRYKNILSGLAVKLSYRIGGFTSKEKIKVLLDTRSPNAKGTIFLPDENYKVFYNKSAPVETINYSGVIVEKLGSSYKQWISGKLYRRGDRVIFQNNIYRSLSKSSFEFFLDKDTVLEWASRRYIKNETVKYQNNYYVAIDNIELKVNFDPMDWNTLSDKDDVWQKEGEFRTGFTIRGYDTERNYFEIFPPIPNNSDPIFNVGGVSEEYLDWASDRFYNKNQYIKVNNGFYRARVSHTSSENFGDDSDKWQLVAALPIVGGRRAYRRQYFSDVPIKIPYGSAFEDIQGVVDFILGYQERLKSWGYEFDDFNKELNVPLNWDTSCKEFMFWTLQNWATGSVITLSPAATRLKFRPQINAAVDTVDSDFYEYSIFKSDGTPLKSDLTNIFRDDNGFTITPSTNTNEGIYHIRANLVYKEHVLLLDNTSIFNDVVYDVVPGYRQGRVKLVGFKTSNWDGGFTTPGFVFDDGKISDWQPFVDYNLGDIVRYKNYYFSALDKIAGANEFIYKQWKQLDRSPTAQLIPNFDYKVEQFRDFYNLESTNFDETQQSLARHLIGYQPRQYLDDIINDNVAQYKFYQGFIKEKGSFNSVEKLFNALRASGFGSVDIREEWAFKVGDYGASDAYVELEFPLDETRMINNPQNVVLTLNSLEVQTFADYNITAKDLTIKTVNYDAKPFVTQTFDSSLNNFGVFKYKVAGYVRDDQVQHIIKDEAELLNSDIERFNVGDKVWLGFTSTNDWNVFQYTNTGNTVISWSVSGTIISLVCKQKPNVVKFDIIGLKNLDDLEGFFKVSKVYGNTIDLDLKDLVLAAQFRSSAPAQDDSTVGYLMKFESARYQDTNTLNNRKYSTTDIRDEIIWIDKTEDNSWAVFENQEAFTTEEIIPTLQTIDQLYGYETKISGNGLWMFVSAVANGSGKVFVYNRGSKNTQWRLSHIIPQPPSYSSALTGQEKFGFSIDCNDDATILVISAPFTSGIRSTYQGTFNPSASYAIGDIVKYDDQFWECVNTVSGDGSTITVETQDWKKVSIFKADANGLPSAYTNQGIVYVYEFSRSFLQFRLRHALMSSNPASNEKFGNKVRLGYDSNSYWLFVCAKNFNNDTGQVHIFKYKNSDWSFHTQKYLDFTYTLGNSYPSIYQPTNGSLYGYDLDIDSGVNRIAVSAPNTNGGAVYVFSRADELFTLVQIIDKYTLSNNITINEAIADNFIDNGDQFGYNIAITNDFMLVSSQTDDISGYNLGSVYYFESQTDNSTQNIYKLLQVIVPPSRIDNERFGTKISVSPRQDVIAISAIGSNSRLQTTFDSSNNRETFNDDSTRNYILEGEEITSTTFDKNATRFYDAVPYTGAVYVYNKIDKAIIYADKLKPLAQLEINDQFGHSVSVSDTSIIVGVPNRDVNDNSIGSVYSYDYTNLSWNKIAGETVSVNIDKFKKSFVYNTESNKLIYNLDFIDPAKGRIPGIADQEIKYQTYYDPAVYELVNNDSLVFDTSNPWTDNHVGELWWDLSTVKYVWYEQGDALYRSTNWGRLFPGATVDIYEWVESKYLPSQWQSLTTEPEASSLGISGNPKFADDSAYSTKFTNDPVSGIRTTMYYYWVRNKVTVPKSFFRSLSARDVANLIIDPKGQNYRYLAVTGESSLSLVNINSQLVDKDISLNLQFYNIDNTDLLVHREYALISNNDDTTKIPAVIENKWFDSLIGLNEKGQRIPDPRLNVKQRYGNGYSPRQTWFENRVEALKQLFEYVNDVLITKQLADEINFNKLNSRELPPSVESGEADLEIDLFEELIFVGTLNLKLAQLKVTVVDGRVVNAEIINPGYGYKVAPKISVLGTGTGAIVKSTIDNQGRINSLTIVKSGRDYDFTTILRVRPFTVLVKTDSEANNRWSTHEWSYAKERFSRAKTQGYNVKDYWSYADWYEVGYSKLTDVDYLIENVKDLNGLPANVSDTVKINNDGSGGWLLLERINTTYSPIFTDDYIVVGKQNSTIQFSSALYNLNNELGFDSKFNFDTGLFDQSPNIELRLILETLRDDILVDDLRIEYVRAFFNSFYYSLHEHKFVDWAFKTSFLKITHNAGSLKQRISFQSDVLDSYQSFVEEAKPYKSKIREFISSYNKVENAFNVVTDFDLPPYYDLNTNKIERVDTRLNLPNAAPWKYWTDNYTYELSDVVIYYTGNQYISQPQVIISGGGLDLTNPLHRTAKATAYIASEKVYQIVIDDPGYGYTSTPTVYISGGNRDETVSENVAKAYAVIGNSKVRTNYISMKYDRYNFNYSVDNFTYTDVFFGTGTKKSFKLTYAPETAKIKFTVIVNDIEYYSSQFDVSLTSVLHDTYTATEGFIIFKEAPVEGQRIVVTYFKNIHIYGAADRINYSYAPTEGQYGKELGLLMNGVDYGGVQLTSIDFEIGGGWDVLPWEASSWDSVLDSNDDFVVLSDGTTRSFILPYTPAEGEVINVYVNGVRIDDPYYSKYDGSTIQPNSRVEPPENVIMDSFIGDGSTRDITIPETANLTGNETDDSIIDEITFRKSTSDGAILPTDRSLIDAFVTGGDLSYATAKGITAEEIVVDGDGFVTTDTSHGPEELVQGQVVDTLSMKVYATPSSGGPNVIVKNYTGDESTSVFATGENLSTIAGVIVTVDNVITDHTVNFAAQTITIDPPPANNSRIAVITIDTAGYDIADKVSFIGDGSTKEFLTSARYNNGDVSGFVTVDGISAPFKIKESTDAYQITRNVVVELDFSPTEGSIIQIMIFFGTLKKWSEVNTQVINVVPGQFGYNLSPAPAFIGPLSAMVFVVVDNEFLRAPDLEYFTYDGVIREFEIDDLQYDVNTLTINDIAVYVNSVRLTPVVDYSIDTTVNKVIIRDGAANVGDEIIIEIYKKADFYIDSDRTFHSYIYDPLVNIDYTFQIPGYAVNTLTSGYVSVFRNGARLAPVVDYTFDSTLNRVRINESSIANDSSSLTEGDEILIIVSLTGNRLVISNKNYTVSSKTKIKVTTFTNHDIIKIRLANVGFRFNTGYDIQVFDSVLFDRLSAPINTSGIVDLPRTVSNKSGVFVSFSRTLLTPNVDYVVLDNLRQIKVLLPEFPSGSDFLQVITFNDQTVKPGYGFMIFKDMMNRYHYKRLNQNVVTYLEKPLTYLDTEITVTDSSVLSEPSPLFNLPGIIEINKERIEYFVKEGNVLKQLRRGTLGTGIGNYYDVGTLIRDIGHTETLPYKEEEIKKTFYGDGTSHIFDLDFVPRAKENTISDDSTISTDWYRDTIPYNYGQCDEIEVFVSGRRLRKNPTKIYDQTLAQDSFNGAGDKNVEAEFSVNGIDSTVRLTDPPAAGDLIVVVYRKGKLWQKANENASFVFGNTDIVNFITSTQSDLPK